MINDMQALSEIDTHIRTILEGSSGDELRGIIKDMLRVAGETPGRASKFQANYLLERMAEIAHDLSEVDGFYRKFHDIMKWIDQGLRYATRLVTPEANGEWLETFDQTVVRFTVPNPKDPEQVMARRERAKTISKQFDEVRTEGDQGGGIIVPGS